MRIVALLFLLLSNVESAQAFHRPSDWISHLIEVKDSREVIPAGSPEVFREEIIELPFSADQKPKGVILLIPAMFQNARLFDLDPENDVSFARYLISQQGLKVYLMNGRGLGKSTSVRGVSLDDLEIDDLPAAIRFVSHQEHGPIFVFGHSQGGIMLQATLAGLTRCPEKKMNCFSSEVAIQNQRNVKAAAISAGSLALTSDTNGAQLRLLKFLSQLLHFPLHGLVDEIKINSLEEALILKPFSHARFWKSLFLKENVSPRAASLLFSETVESSSIKILYQLAHGIRDHGIRTVAKQGKGESYPEFLGNIKTPIMQLTYGEDTFAEEKPTYRDDFSRIGSEQKKFFHVDHQGHEDFLMSSTLHPTWDGAMEWLLNAAHE